MVYYLDNAATTKPKKEVVEAMLPYLTDEWHNPSSLYSEATKVKGKIEEARKIVADFIGAESNEIYFTSGGSESNCWVIQGFVNECWSKGFTPTIITSKIEHKSVLDCVENMMADKYYIGVNDKGLIDVEELNKILIEFSALRESEIIDNELLVSIQFANNEIGTVQNIKEIAKLVHKYGGLFHTDAVQAFGHLPIDVTELGIDMLSASGHKIGAPKGVGFLYKKNNVNIKPLIYGSQMDGMRGGTENTPYIIGMAKAVELCDLKFRHFITMCVHRNYLINRLVKEFNCKLNGCIATPRLPNNVNVTFPQNITGESLLYMLDMSGIKVSTGSACNSKSIEPSKVLKAIGLNDSEAMRTVRFTLSNDINDSDIDKVIEEIDKSIKVLMLEEVQDVQSI